MLKRKGKKTNFIAKLNETKNTLNSSRKNVVSRFFALKKELAKKYLLAGAMFLGFLLFISFTLIVYQNIFNNRFYFGLEAGGVNLGGKTFSEVRGEIQLKMDKISNNGIVVIYQNKKITIPASVIGETPDLSFDVFHFDADKTLANAFGIGRSGNILKDSMEQIIIIFTKAKIKIEHNIDEKKITDFLFENFREYEKPAQDAKIIFNNGEAKVVGEIHGKIFDYENIVKEIEKKLSKLDESPVTIILKTDYPIIYEKEASALLIPAKNALNSAPITLIVPDDYNTAKKEWVIDKNELLTMLAVKKNVFQYGGGWFSSPELKEEFYIGLKQGDVEKYFNENIRQYTDINPIDAKFKVENEKVVEFEASKNGRKLSAEKTFKNFEDAVKLASESNSAEKIKIGIIIEEAKSNINNENVNDLGVKELIGTGHSNFSGSSWSRKHNISTGALSAHGTLVKPGQEFSMNQTLGEINAATGYLPEMVIKGNETIPEYGGGLCQVGTTMFRAALDAGLPISERQNHSYRVRYYEPAGTDATIYGPHPDLRFINDTGNYILIQRRINDNDIYFEIWGTKDGRIASTTYPVVYNISAPPPTKIIETEDLKLGEKKCTEHAIYGADAYFDYTVAYPNGEIKEE
ncbi:MAG: VanW family protein, partial [Patescibacteria group bacterium]